MKSRFSKHVLKYFLELRHRKGIEAAELTIDHLISMTDHEKMQLISLLIAGCFTDAASELEKITAKENK